ncbi:MAG: hypothetical protein HY735_38430 [Verrucomicrobia bacterium]|nr:hypothetical protein [Verrucomicrobiota bacterium]
MKPAPIPTLRLLAVLGIASQFLGCTAQSVKVSQETVPVYPAITNVLTNAANPTNTVAPADTAGIVATTNQAAPARTFGEKLQSGEAQLSEGAAGIVSLAQGGVGEEVLLAYVQNHPTPFQLTAEEILYLADLGIPESVISAMIKHTGARAEVAEQRPAPPTNNVAVTAPGAVNGQTLQAPANQAATLPSAPSYAITATPEFEAGVQPAPPLAVAPAPPVQYDYFSSSLAPYGTWYDFPEYGRVWQPTVAIVDSSWRPYCHRGRWLYSDYGWYWHSDYSWGWAPFHYGRWCSYPGRGWLWIPDRTWGPAWVTWRYSDAYSGWAPLPPGAYYEPGFGFSYHSRRVGFSFDFGLGWDYYTFVPTARFYDPYPWRHRLYGPHVVNVFNRTTIINNYVERPNRLVVNEGIDRSKIATITRSEIRKVEVRDTPQNTIRSVRPDRLERNGSDLVVYRSRLPVETSETPATRGGQEIRKPTRPDGNARIGSPARPGAASSLVSNSEASRRPELISKSGIQSGAAAVGSRPSSQPGTTIPSRRPDSNSQGSLREAATSPAASAPVLGKEADTPGMRTIRSTSLARPAAGASPVANSTAPNGDPANQAAFKSAEEGRGSATSEPQLIQTPIRPLQRRESSRSTLNTPSVVQSRTESSAAATIDSQSRLTPGTGNVRSPRLRPRSELESRLAEIQSSTRSTAQSSRFQANDQPLIRSRALTQQDSSSPFAPRPASPYTPPTAPSYVTPTPSYSPPPAIQTPDTPRYRQELYKPPTPAYSERRGYSPSVEAPNYGSPSTYSRPQFSNPQPSRGFSDYSSRPSPSPSGTISIVPSQRQGPPPTQISPSQMTPSNRSTSSSGNTIPSRPTESSSGRERQER